MQKLYECMIVVDTNKAKEEYAKAEAAALECITRHGASIVKAIKWDERRLAYEIKGAKRGTYILVHFEAEPDAIAKIDRQFILSETVLRALILVDVDGIETETGSGRERAEAATATPVATPEKESAESADAK